MASTCDERSVRIESAWGAVVSMALAAFILIASEFLPVSLLPLVVHDLAITEGQTGQAISISGVFAMLTSLAVAQLTRGVDRRIVASGFTSRLVVSGAIVASAPNYPILMVGRILLGMASTMFLFMGQFALFTYLRPYLEVTMGFTIEAMALLAVGMVALNSASLSVAALLVAWGFFGTAALVGWGTWVSRHISDDAEAGGGLSVAVIQLGITAGATGGGYLFDTIGWWGPFAMATVILAASSILALAAMANARRSST